MRPWMVTVRFLGAIQILLLLQAEYSEATCREIEFPTSTEQGKALDNHTITNITVPNGMCARHCFINPDCVSVNIGPSTSPGQQLCQLNDADRYQYPKDYKDRAGYSYVGVTDNKCKDLPCSSKGRCRHGYGDEYVCSCEPGWFGKQCQTEYGKSAEGAAPNCRAIKTVMPWFPSGNYWIKPTAGQAAFLAYCDMDTDGGGWTLVWSYTFLKYDDFKNAGNAVTPRPKKFNTPVPASPGRVSQTPPFNETDYNAIEYTIWKNIGSEILLKSNINNWVVCVPGSGSFVKRIDGSMSCRMVNQIAFQCSKVPISFRFTGKGYSLRETSNFYYYETDTSNHWPTHDPCGANSANHLKGVPNPHGNIYVR